MDVVPPPHIADVTLGAYRSGQLDERTAGAVREHLKTCADCRKRAGSIPDDPRARPTVDAPGPDVTRTYVRPQAQAPPASRRLPPALADHPDYSIKRELGRGGMGVVYLAHNTLLGRDEVLKVMAWPIAGRSGGEERFLREIRAVAQLRHPNIVTAYSATRRGDGIVFAMELVEGLDLARLVKSKGPIPVAHACHFVYQAALGLQHAHENGLVHRDIKPGNLMLSRAGNRATVKILDFGLAKVSHENGGLTEEGHALGTPDFMAPEQVVDAQSADIRADIYSLGATLFYLLTGRTPFQARTLVEIYRAHVAWNPDRLNLARPEVPAELAAVVETMMAREPASRFQTPGEAAMALAPFFKKGHEAGRQADPEVPLPGQNAEPPATTGAAPAVTPDNAQGSTIRESGWENLIVFDEADAAATDDATPDRPAWLWPAAVFTVLVLGVVVAWASGLFAVRRDDRPSPREDLAERTVELPAAPPRIVSIPADEPLTAPETPRGDAAVTEPFRPEVQAAPDGPALASRSNSPAPEPVSPPKPAAADGGSSGFHPLFHGTDLTGWVPQGGRLRDWLIQDGSLTFRASHDRPLFPNRRLTSSEKKRLAFRARNDRASFLFTERSYLDFVLRLEFRTSGAAGSGIVLADLDRGDRLPRYAEFAIGMPEGLSPKPGDFLSWNFGSLVQQLPARSVDLKKGEDWNRLELESRGGALRLSLNGHPVEYDDPIKLQGPRRIGLRGMSGDAWFRNIEIQGRPATVNDTDGPSRLLLGRVIYADDLSDPASGWGRDDVDNGPGLEPFHRNYERGLYFLEAPPGWSGHSAWNAWGHLSQDFQFQVVGRVLGAPQAEGAWALIIDSPAARGFQVSIDRAGRFTLESSFWGAEKYPNDPRIGPIAHPAIHPGHEWNEVTLRVRKRRLEVFVNSVRIGELPNLGWDLLPAQPQIAVAKPDPGTRIRAEFDWMEIRELAAEAP